MEFRDRTVLVTGASGGIGEAFARALAARGASVILVARSADKLESLASELRERHPSARMEPVALDLTDPAAGAALVDAVAERGLTVDALVNNAGLGANGDFVDLALDRSLAQVDLDVRSVVELTARFLPSMVERRRGCVINVASTAAFQPVPTMAVYAAAKAFVRSFTEALWEETRGTGVRVMAVAPGAVQTGFFAASGAEFMTRGRLQPARVVDATFAHVDGTAPVVVPGLWNRLGTLGERVAPRRLLVRGSRRIVAPSD